MGILLLILKIIGILPFKSSFVQLRQEFVQGCFFLYISLMLELHIKTIVQHLHISLWISLNPMHPFVPEISA